MFVVKIFQFCNKSFTVFQNSILIKICLNHIEYSAQACRRIKFYRSELILKPFGYEVTRLSSF